MLETVVPKAPNAAVMLVRGKRKGEVKDPLLIVSQKCICAHVILT